MQINKIVLYSVDGQVRELTFSLGKVNIITGESKSGKSAIIEIVNYCLASGSCDIPEGIIRDSVHYFCLYLTFNDGETAFIARENPNIRGLLTVTNVYLVRGIGESLPKFEDIQSNMDVDSLKEFLTRRIGIHENRHVPDAQSRDALSANFKHSRFYCYQPQYLVANPHLLFYNQNKEFVPQSIKDTLPYFLGAINEDALLIENEISLLKRQLNRLNRERKENERIKSEGISQANSLIEEAREIGILQTGESLNLETDIYDVLFEINKWEYKPLEVAPENSGLKDLVDKRRDLRAELSRIADSRKAASEYLKNSFGYSEEVREQEIRLETIHLYDHSRDVDSSVCPLCDNVLVSPIPTIENINLSLSNIREDLRSTKAENPRIQGYIETINSQYHSVETELRTVENNITALYVENEKARTLRDLNIRRGKVIGRVSLFLESIERDSDSQSLETKIEDLKGRINRLEASVDSENEKERLLSILNKINLQMSKWVEQLDVEYEDNAIRFDINKLTMFIDTDIKPIALPQIGSGANWVAYHLLIVFALHQHFIQNSRPVPRFVIIDQPTQVYYPPEKSKELVEVSSDEVAVGKMFKFIFNVVMKLAPELQVIIMDHAFLNDADFQNSVVEVWRDGLKLIPSNWGRINYKGFR